MSKKFAENVNSFDVEKDSSTVSLVYNSLVSAFLKGSDIASP